MGKYTIIVVLCGLNFIKINCLFWGDNCVTHNREFGICKPLPSCPNVLDEVNRAGNPIPPYVKRKLQGLSCGFDGSQPMVCCTSDKNNEIDHHYVPPPLHNTYYDNGPSDREKPGYNNHGDSYDSANWNDNNDPTENPFDRNTNDNSNNNRHKTNGENRKHGLPDISRHPNLRFLPMDCGAIDEDRIFGGDSTHLYQMPWMALLSYNDDVRGPRLICGGSLINHWYVLTAAHCVKFLPAGLTLDGIILGEHDVRTNPDCEDNQCAAPSRNVTIERTIVHPGYTPSLRADDIALIKLAEPADFRLNTMKPICLPITSELQNEDLLGKKAVVAGWGVTEEGMQSPVLMSVNVPIVSNQECQSSYNGAVQINDGQLCAGGEEKKDSCSGDSGGPLMFPGRVGSKIQYVQRGIVSYGTKRCALDGYPAIYTRVSYFMDWILDNISS